MANLPNVSAEAASPPYLSFARFLESLDSIAACTPRQVSRATWDRESSYTASLLAKTYNFLGLTDENGIPTPVLHQLASQRALRADVLREVLRKAYGGIIDALEKGGSQEAVDAALARYRLSSDTHRKAVSFVLQACRYAGVAVPPATGGRSRISHAKAAGTTAEQNREVTSITVPLRSGGEITLLGQFNPFLISAEDRNFVFKLVDQLAAYGVATERPEESEVEIEEDEAPF